MSNICVRSYAVKRISSGSGPHSPIWTKEILSNKGINYKNNLLWEYLKDMIKCIRTPIFDYSQKFRTY